jgi:hypothetical protein
VCNICPVSGVHTLPGLISSKHGETQVTEPSSGEMFRVHEQPNVISNDRDILPSMIFMIEYGSGFAGCDFT